MDLSAARDRKASKYGDRRFVRDCYAQKHTARAGLLRHLVEQQWVEKYLVGRVLDCGIGTGRFVEGLLVRGHEVIGVDFSLEMLRYLQETRRQNDFHLVRSDLGSLPIRVESVDSVMCIRVLFHLPNYLDVLQEFMRVAKTGGRVVFDVRSGEHLALCQRLARLLRLRRVPGEREPSDPIDYSVAVHLSEIRALANKFGGRLVALHPYDFLSTYWVGAIPGVMRIANALLSIKWILQLWLRIEVLLSWLLPPALLSRHFVILEKEPGY